MLPSSKRAKQQKSGKTKKRKMDAKNNGATCVLSNQKTDDFDDASIEDDFNAYSFHKRDDKHDERENTCSSDSDDDLLLENINDNEIYVDLSLGRAQIFKNFLDRIRHQNSDLPLMFKKDGLYIQSMEPGKQAWVHAQILASGCDTYEYRVNTESIFLTLEFKSIFANVKSIDANDLLRIRVIPNLSKNPNRRNDRYNVSLICMNDKNKLTSEWILDTIGDEKISAQRMVARINNYWDYEYAVLASELQRRITMYSSNKIKSLYFVCQGTDLIIKQKHKFKTSMVKGVQTEFIDAFIRGPSSVYPLLTQLSRGDDNEDSDDNDSGTILNDSMLLSKAPEVPIIVAVELKHLVNACKGSSTNNNSKQMIHLRISNDKSQDILIEEKVGNVGKLTLGVIPIQ